MKDFAKSIVCNSVTEKEFNTEADLRRWCMDHNYTYTPVGGGYYRLEDDKPGSKRPDLEAHVKVGNSKVGNGLSDSYEFLMSAGKNDYNSIKEEIKKAGGWTPEIKAKARKTSDTLKKKAKELVETAHKQAAELERLAGDIESI